MDNLSDFVRSTEGARTVGRIFGAPLVVKGITWFPVDELIVWGIMTVVARRKHPEFGWRKSLGTGALTMGAILAVSP